MSGPAEKLRLARELAAIALGMAVEDLPLDADIGCSVGEDRILRVYARIRRPASVPWVVSRITFGGRFTP